MSDFSESLEKIHDCVEQLSHSSKDIYARALRLNYSINTASDDLWTERFLLHERAFIWAKKHMVPRKCSLWQIHQTLLTSAKQRITKEGIHLTHEESELLDLPYTTPVSIWSVLGKLPRFFM
jgi:hypothetical protein